MKSISSLLLLIIFANWAGCASPNTRPYVVGPRWATNIYEAFAYEARVKNLDYNRNNGAIVVQDLPPDKAGLCYYNESHEDHPWVIYLDSKILNTHSPDCVYRLLWHELGHCVFRLPHSEDPTDIMGDQLEPMCFSIRAEKSLIDTFWEQVNDRQGPY